MPGLLYGEHAFLGCGPGTDYEMAGVNRDLAADDRDDSGANCILRRKLRLVPNTFCEKCVGFYVCACDFAAVNRSGENLSALNSAFPLKIQSRTIFAVMGASRIPFR